MPNKKANLIAWLLLLVAFLGFVDATYLTVKHYRGDTINCLLTSGCNTVTQSRYSEIFGVPVALLGSLYYLSVFLLCIAYFDRKQPKILALAATYTVVGLVASAYFVALQAFVIKAWCQYCLASAVTSTVLFGLGVWYNQLNKETSDVPDNKLDSPGL